MKKLFILILTLALLTAMTVPAWAAELTQDGLEVKLTTNKTSYGENDPITAVLTVTNTTDEPMKDLELKALIPKGFTAKNTSLTADTLEAGESLTLTVVYNPKNMESLPATGDAGVILLIVIAVAVTLLLVFGGKAMARRMLCIVLCCAIIAGIGVMPAKALELEKKSLSISRNVHVDGKSLNIQMQVRYLPANAYIDTDADGIVDYMEQLVGTDPNKADTDGDGLDDYLELLKTDTDPTLTDTDGDGTADGSEDADNDGLLNHQELALGTDPAKADTDSDGLTDGQELALGTDPLSDDTDEDGVSDGYEITIGTDPLVPEDTFSVSEEDGIASVEVELEGQQVETLTVTPVDNQTLFPETIPGYLGQAYNFEVEGSFDTADISFRYDASALPEGAKPEIYYFNEKNQTLEKLETTVNNGVATATVEHFSTYILLDSSTYDGAFTWEDTWDSTDTYTAVEVVFLVDDSGSMGPFGDYNDPTNQRLTVVQNMIDTLPDGCKIGVVWFATKSKLLTPELTTDRKAAKALLTTENFKSSGSYTNMYGALNEAMTLFETTDPNALKTIITVTDGRAHDHDALHDSTIAKAQENQIRLYTVGLGGDLIITDYLEPLAEQTGGSYHWAENSSQLAAIYAEISKMIDISVDTDGDGIPNYYEDNLIAFNGTHLALDKASADTDGDGLDDSEEVEIQLVYSEDRSQVLIKGTMLSSPILEDTDFDGILDPNDAVPYDNTFTGKHKSSATTSSVDCVMDYSWFLGNNSIYNPELSKLSILFASEIYAGSTLSMSDASGTVTTSGSNITEVMDYFGFDKAMNYGLNLMYDDKHVSEIAIGYHNVNAGDVSKTVLAITVRGTNGTIEEWSSNCDIGDINTHTSGDDWLNTLNHKGFDVTANRILRIVADYIDQQNLDQDSLVYWVTGHSRGAAIANIIGANLEKNDETAFTYTFATPNCTLDKDAHTYTSIFNVINEDDFVPCLPMEYWGYTTYGRSTTTASIKEDYEKEWEKLTGIGDYNPDSSGMDDCVRDIGLILPENCDPRIESFRYTCACHGDGSNDTITIKNGGVSEDSREKAIAKIPACAREVCIITRFEGGWIGGWDFTVCQLPAYLMQLLAAFMGGEVDAYRFAVELNIAKRYEAAKGAIVSAGISGIEHPHYTECYYVLANHLVAEDFS